MTLGGVNNVAELIVVVQGLRGNLVAQKGRKVAGIAPIKSVAYSYFLDKTSTQVESMRQTPAGNN